MILPALRLGGYDFETQVLIDARIGGHKHKVDLLVGKMISAGWCRSNGSRPAGPPNRKCRSK